jgi:hypothetical protein
MNWHWNMQAKVNFYKVDTQVEQDLARHLILAAFH